MYVSDWIIASLYRMRDATGERLAAGLCPDCGYDLRESKQTEVCPECGCQRRRSEAGGP